MKRRQQFYTPPGLHPSMPFVLGDPPQTMSPGPEGGEGVRFALPQPEQVPHPMPASVPVSPPSPPRERRNTAPTPRSLNLPPRRGSEHLLDPAALAAQGSPAHALRGQRRTTSPAATAVSVLNTATASFLAIQNKHLRCEANTVSEFSSEMERLPDEDVRKLCGDLFACMHTALREVRNFNANAVRRTSTQSTFSLNSSGGALGMDDPLSFTSSAAEETLEQSHSTVPALDIDQLPQKRSPPMQPRPSTSSLPEYHLSPSNSSQISSPGVSPREVSRTPLVPREQIAPDLVASAQCICKMHDAWEDISTFIINDYVIENTVARGAYGTVYSAYRYSDGSHVAIKKLNKTPLRYQRMHFAEDEIETMKALEHDHIVPLLEVVDDSRDQFLYLVMPWLPGTLPTPNRDGLCAPTPLATVKRYMVQLVSGLQYLHANGIVHRDIKPDNIMVDADGAIKIGDFGLSKAYHAVTITNTYGTPAFLAPELCSEWFDSRGDEDEGAMVGGGGDDTLLLSIPAHRCAFASDVWALGVTLYTMLFGRLPFFAPGHKALMRLIADLNVEVPIPPNCNPHVTSVLRGLLHKSQDHRMTLDELARHPFLRPANDK